MPPPRWPRSLRVALGLFLGLTAVGIVIVLGIVATEGTGGLFNRKRKALEVVMPEAVPVVDEIEQRVENAR